MSIQFETRDTRVAITVTEIDAATIGEFIGELAYGLLRYTETPLPRPGFRTSSLVVDLSLVSFLNARGARALIEADAAAGLHGGRVVVSGARGEVRRCLEVVGVFDRMQHPAERWAEP
jgi:anti-anti-sigma regulatory factor